MELCNWFLYEFLLYKNYAFLGPYVYVFMLISLAVYIKFISESVIKAEVIILNMIIKVSRILFKNLIYPFKVIFYNLTGKNN